MAIRTIPAIGPLNVNVVVDSPHAVAYRIWTREPNLPWVAIHTGIAGENAPVHLIVEANKGTSLAYWIGVGGNTGTSFRVILTIAQGGRILANGAFVEEGMTDSAGVARVQREDVVFG